MYGWLFLLDDVEVFVVGKDLKVLLFVGMDLKEYGRFESNV